MEPEQPAIRREKSMYTPHAVPMKRPPMKASRGRKEFIVLPSDGNRQFSRSPGTSVGSLGDCLQ
jgi:hypothetical protein